MPDRDFEVLFSGNIAVEYGQFYFDNSSFDDEDFLDPSEAFDGQENGICGAAQIGKLFFVAGVHNGTAAIQIERHLQEPALEEAYDEVVEASFQKAKEEIALCEWACENVYPLALPVGEYRIRYSVDGMGYEYGEEDDWDEPVPGQKHLIQIWPAKKAGDKIVKTTSDIAAYWHKEWGGL